MPSSLTFNYTGAQQTWVVPAGVTSVVIECLGAAGFDSSNGKGGRAVGTFTVTPGETLNVFVGGSPTATPLGGFNGGGAGRNATADGSGGGGATDVRRGGVQLSNRIIVAGGGGGRGIGPSAAKVSGGAGGGPVGAQGANGIGTGGGGGTQSAGGAAGTGASSTVGSPGALGVGGAASIGTGAYGGGGGGGGYYGGGGGGNAGAAPGAPGGGGGSNGPTAALSVDVQGYQSGNGQVTITYEQLSPVTFNYTGAVQTFVVPAGVSTLTAECFGAAGGVSNFGSVAAGLGGRAVATFPVTPGETLNVYVGQDGTGAGNATVFNGGGAGAEYTNAGGGASDVRRGTALTNRIIAAGGGGAAGAGNNSTSFGGKGGDGGGTTGAAGLRGENGSHSTLGSGGGGGGTQSSGGVGGSSPDAGAGAAGVLGTGGNAGTSPASYGGGGGGGGWYGGGGGGGIGGFNLGSGGGGGGSNGSTATLTVNQQGVRTGHGQVILTWATATPVTPATAATQWATRAGVSSAALATAWAILSTLTRTTPDLRWSLRTPVVVTAADTTWNTAGVTTPVDNSTSTNWRVDARIVQSVGTAWMTVARVVSSLATTWSTTVGVQQTAVTTWATRVLVTRTAATTWAIIERPFVLTDSFRVQVETTPGTWHDITGAGHRIDVNRHDGDPGTMLYEVLDADLDPVESPALQMGDGLRLRARKGNADEWVNLFTGTINDLQVTVDPRAAAGRQVNVSMSATDNVAQLSNVTEVRSVETIDELRWLVGTTVPYVINGSSAPLATGAVIGTNDNATLWDQILVTRDTALGYAWVDGDNALRVYDSAALSATPAATITPAVYSHLDRDFTLDQVINEVTVNWRRYDIGTEKSTDVPYGPYSDAPSVAKWGARAATFTIVGPAVEEDEATVSTYAAGVLARNSTAEHRAKTADIPVNTPSRLALVRDLDLNTLASVTYQDSSTVATLRVVAIRHSINVHPVEGIFWQTSLDFALPSGVALPSQTPPTGVPNIPPGSIGSDELDNDTSDAITGAAEQAAQALDDAAEAFNAASDVALTVDGWKYSGTTKIDGGDIQTDTIGAVQIGANAITAKHTLTGPLIQTTAALNRGVKFNSSGLFAWDASGNPTFSVDASTGAAVFKGSILSGSSITGVTIEGGSVATGAAGTARAVLKDNKLAFYTAANSELGNVTTTGNGIIVQALGANRNLQLYGDGVFIDGGAHAVSVSPSLDVDRLDVSGGGSGGTVIAKVWDGNLDMNFNHIANVGSITGGPIITGSPQLNAPILTGVPTLTASQFVSGANQDLRVTGAGAFTTGTSSERFKENVSALAAELDVADVYRLEPVAFNFRDRESWGDERFAGVIAERAHEHGLSLFVQYDNDGQPHGFDYDFFTAGLLLAVRDLNARVLELEARLTERSNDD